MDARPDSKTLLEWLQWTYPDHVARICEEVRRQDPKNAEAVLAGAPGTYPIAHCFVWAHTVEGHDYWQDLSGEPFGKPRKKYKKGKSLSDVAKSWRRTNDKT